MIIEPDAINAPHPNPLPGGEGTSDANFRLFAVSSSLPVGHRYIPICGVRKGMRTPSV